MLGLITFELLAGVKFRGSFEPARRLAIEEVVAVSEFLLAKDFRKRNWSGKSGAFSVCVRNKVDFFQG